METVKILISPTRLTSKRMRMVKSKDTSLERNAERILSSMNLQYIKQPSIEGRPDFKIKDTNILIFCDSSFWHGRRKKEISGKAFTKNKEFWKNKLKQNKLRDRKITTRLRRQGWRVLRFWDDDIFKRSENVKNTIAGALSAKA